MARQSVASKMFSPIDRRIEPSPGLTPDETEVWKVVTEGKPAEWFTSDCVILLENYCKGTVRARWLEEKLKTTQDAIDNEGYGEEEVYKAALCLFDKLMKWMDQNNRNVMAFATKMRLTNQARTDSRVAANQCRKIQVGEKKPWESEEMAEATDLENLDTLGLA